MVSAIALPESFKMNSAPYSLQIPRRAAQTRAPGLDCAPARALARPPARGQTGARSQGRPHKASPCEGVSPDSSRKHSEGLLEEPCLRSPA